RCHSHRVARARTRLLEIERDAFVLQDARRRLQRRVENCAQVGRRKIARGEQVLHQLFSRFTIGPPPWSVSSSIRRPWCTPPSLMWAKLTPCSTASAHALNLGIMPLPTLSWAILSRSSAAVSRGISELSSFGSPSRPGTAVR